MEGRLPVGVMISLYASGTSTLVIALQHCMVIAAAYGPSLSAPTETSLLQGVPTRQCVYGIQGREVVLRRCVVIPVGSDLLPFIYKSCLLYTSPSPRD